MCSISVDVVVDDNYRISIVIHHDMALRKVRSNIDRIFDKSLTDLIRGIRNNKDNEVG